MKERKTIRLAEREKDAALALYSSLPFLISLLLFSPSIPLFSSLFSFGRERKGIEKARKRRENGGKGSDRKGIALIVLFILFSLSFSFPYPFFLTFFFISSLSFLYFLYSSSASAPREEEKGLERDKRAEEIGKRIER